MRVPKKVTLTYNSLNNEKLNRKQVFIQCLIGLFIIALNLVFPSFFEQTRYLFLALVILVIGMPHGALDHFIDGEIEQWNPFTFNKKFYGWYLSAVAIYTLLWFFYPLFCFAFFMLITLYHFGQADAERFEWVGISKICIHFARGFTVVGLILYGDLEYASSVIESITNFNYQELSEAYFNTEITRWVIAGFYPLVFIIVGLLNHTKLKFFLTYLLDAIIVSLLFIYCDPVWAFGLYFGLWHSFNHVKVMIRFLRSREQEADFTFFYKYSFAFSLLSYLGILFIYNILDAFGSEELMVSLLFAVISVLTLPHMMVVQKMYSINS